jgi:GNAT superfamily N-acetyltransferase
VSGKLSRWVGDLRTLPHDAALAYRRGGRGDLWAALAHQSLYCVCRHGHLRIIAQELSSFRRVPPPPGVRITEVATSDWPALRSVVTQRELNGFSRRLAAGMVGLIAWREGSPIGYTWITERLLPFVTPCRFTLPANAAYLFDLYVIPQERSGGIGSALVSARLEIARARGFEEAWRMISPANGASLRTMEKTASGGIRVIAELRYIKVLSKVYSWSA